MSDNPNFYELDNLASIRADFPILARTVRGRPLVYLDNAATTQKPRAVIERLGHFYEYENGNIYRGVHGLSEAATAAYEAARATVQLFLNAAEPGEIVFTSGCTAAINLVAGSFGRRFVGAGDEIVLTEMEHHSNIVPWQMLCESTGARVRVIPIEEDGSLSIDSYASLLSDRTRLVAITHVSNVLGTINPVREVADLAHRAGARVLVDGAQAVAHFPVDVRALDADFYTFSGHKLFGPTGIGVLYGKRDLLAEMPPVAGGGGMVDRVDFEASTYQEAPAKFEAGTPPIADALGLAAAIDYLETLGWPAIMAHEKALLRYASARLRDIEGLRILGTAADKAAVLSFIVAGCSALDLATLADQAGVAIRSGHHCAQPLFKRLGLPGAARASFALYNTLEEVDILIAALRKAKELLA